jgi:GntR family transcriptional regulator, transcriptional repressor for pyruvate dehydrogenase complex
MEPEPASAIPVDYLRQVRREDRLADKVAELLQQAILGGQFAPGERLPPERVLGERFGVSRTVVREAVRSLAAKGLVEVRHAGGTVVARVGAGSVAETMRLYLQGAAIEYDAIHEVRVMLEVHVAGAAAERATGEDVAAIRGHLAAMAASVDHADRARHDEEFHRSVVLATHNPLHVVMLDAIGEPIRTVRERTLTVPGRPGKALREHERIVDRIAAHDPEGARHEMRLHLEDARRAWERLGQLSREAGSGTQG